MKIEEAIQSKFADTNQKAIVNLLYTASWLSGRISEVLKKQGITHQQYNVLRILRGAKGQPVSLKYIRERMLDRMSDASRIVDKLHNKRYLERKQCPSDRRNVDITITNEGLSLLQKL
ncbi:MAG: MarR family transcriptional regulator, partial [Bacteroidota bacterium]